MLEKVTKWTVQYSKGQKSPDNKSVILGPLYVSVAKRQGTP